MSSFELPSHDGFTIRELSKEEFRPLWEEYAPLIFDNAMRLHLDDLLSHEEKRSIKSLHAQMGSPLVLRYGLFEGERFIGWHSGDQRSGQEYYMRNSAVLPDYRKRGLYSALVEYVVDRATELGFQLITSRHTVTNNTVIIAKLKLGFTITGIEVSDVFGTLVNLTYFTNADRRRVIDVRSGQSRPNEDLRRWLGL